MLSLRRAASVRLLTACVLLVCACRPALAQTTRPAVNNILTRIERSIEQGRYTEAEQPLLAYAVAHPKDARALDLLAQLRYHQHRFDEAASLYRRVLALDPTRTLAKISLAHAVHDAGRHDEARALLVEATTAPATDPRIVLALAEGLLFVGEFQRARAATDRLPAALKHRAALARHRGQLSCAWRATATRRLAPGDAARGHKPRRGRALRRSVAPRRSDERSCRALACGAHGRARRCARARLVRPDRNRRARVRAGAATPHSRAIACAARRRSTRCVGGARKCRRKLAGRAGCFNAGAHARP